MEGSSKALEVERAPASGRRAFVKRAGLAALGAAAAAPVVGSASARAAGTSPAYTDAPNTFTADQTIQARLGIGTSPGDASLRVVRSDAGPAVSVDAHTMALALRHDTDWAGQTYDLVNLYHKSVGDAIFIAHQGGVPPGFSGPPPGGDSGVNVLIPYYIDDTTTGRNGTIVNDRTGMRGLYIESQAVVDNSHAIDLQHFGNSYAMYMIVQPPTYGQPVGTGGAVYIDDYSTTSTIRIHKWRNGSEPILDLIGNAGTQVEGIMVRDPNALRRWSIRNDGRMLIVGADGQVKVEFTSTGQLAVGNNVNFQGVQFQAWMNQNGIARTVALVNTDGGAGSGTQIEFDDGGFTYGTLKTIYDNRGAGSKSSSMVFHIRSSDNLTERLRLSGTGIGFFGANPVAKPAITGAKKGNDALANLLTALSRLGLITDSTTG